MNDTFASKKVCQDNRWPWGDDIEKKAPMRQPKNTGFSLFFGHPLKNPKKLENIWSVSFGPKSRKVQNAPIAEIPSFAKHYVFRGLAAAKRSRVRLRPPRGRVFHRPCSNRDLFRHSFFETILAPILAKAILHYKNRGFGTFRNGY